MGYLIWLQEAHLFTKIGGGHPAHPFDPCEGFELLESEAVVSLAARRGGEEKPPFVRRGEEHFQSIKDGLKSGTFSGASGPTR